jgi:phage repressor protein C with HTH and peptisase S24 domain
VLAPNIPSANIVAVKTQSDHMCSTINPGDLVLINKSATVADSSGGIFAVDTGDGIVMARFKKTLQDGWSISYDNPQYPASSVSQAVINKQKVVGKVIANLAVQRL